MDRHSKKDAKQQKINSRSDSMASFIRQEVERQIKELEQENSQDLTHDPLYRKAKKFWSKCDDKYFRNVSMPEIADKKQITTTNRVQTIGSSEQTTFGNYFEQMIESVIPSFRDPNKLKVLIKSLDPPFLSSIASYQIQSGMPNYHSESSINLEEKGIKVSSMIQKNLNQQQNEPSGKNQGLNLKNIRLDLEQYSDDISLCKRIDKLAEIRNNYLHEIDQQIAIWEWQLQKVNQENNISWNQLIMKVKQQPELLKIKSIDDYQRDISHIQNKILWTTVLRSFEVGFKDKTSKMFEVYIENEKNFNLKPPKGLTSTQKKYFQTDCKICFCSDNNDSNQVLYCDSCNTSYHLACYGLSAIPRQDPYYCERCTYTKKYNHLGIKTKNIFCQICSKNNFPMKRIDEHFYHVTCLILFNLVEFNDNKMALRSSLTHKKILQMVIENQLNSDDCDYCRKPINPGANTLGMKIKCSYDDSCSHYYHPICAYLSGCKLIVKKVQKHLLEIQLVCNSHFPSRQEQVYLRRYMLNFNEASSKSREQFQKHFQEEISKQKLFKDQLVSLRSKYPNRILYLTKFIKNILKSKQQREDEKIQTETQVLLRKIKQNQGSSGSFY